MSLPPPHWWSRWNSQWPNSVACQVSCIATSRPFLLVLSFADSTGGAEARADVHFFQCMSRCYAGCVFQRIHHQVTSEFRIESSSSIDQAIRNTPSLRWLYGLYFRVRSQNQLKIGSYSQFNKLITDPCFGDSQNLWINPRPLFWRFSKFMN